MISSLFDFFTRKRKKEQETAAKIASPTFVIDRTGVTKAVSGLDMATSLTKDTSPRPMAKPAMHNIHLNKDYHLCGGKYIEKGVRLLKPKEELIPVDIVYNGFLAGASTVKLRKGEGNNISWENVQNMDMVKTTNGYHVASVLIKKPQGSTNTTHHMHLAFYTDGDGQENWDNNKGKNFSFEIPIMSAQATAQSSTQSTAQTSQSSSQNNSQPNSKIINNLLGTQATSQSAVQTTQSSNQNTSQPNSNIINNLLGVSPKKQGSR